jgi:hypothetical protein
MIAENGSGGRWLKSRPRQVSDRDFCWCPPYSIDAGLIRGHNAGVFDVAAGGINADKHHEAGGDAHEGHRE